MTEQALDKLVLTFNNYLSLGVANDPIQVNHHLLTIKPVSAMNRAFFVTLFYLFSFTEQMG